MSVHLSSEQVQGDLQQCSHTEESRVKNHVPAEKAFLGRIEQFEEKWKVHPNSGLEDAARLALSQRQNLKCLKQEYRADFLDCSVRELQRPIHSNRLAID